MKTSQSIFSMNRFISFLFVLAILIFTVACDKEESPDTNGGDDSGSFQFGNGTLVAVQAESVQNTPIGDMTITVGTAVAVFSNDGNYSSFVNAGSVTADGHDLKKFDNNSYAFTPGLTDPTGIEFGNSVDWKVAGSDHVPAFEYTMTGGFPSIGTITADAELSKSSSYTISVSSIANADSVYFMVKEVYKALPGNTRSYTFSADELQNLSNGTAAVTVAAWRYKTSSFSGKTMYFINETVRQKTANVSN